MKIKWILLLASAFICSATPIHDPNRKIHVSSVEVLKFDQAENLCLSTNTPSHNCKLGVTNVLAHVGSKETALITRNDNIGLVFYRPHQNLLPAVIASQHMRTFFAIVATYSTHQWPITRPETSLFTVTQGPFQFTISCLGGTIPWDVLALVARRFSTPAESMYASTFDAVYTDARNSATLWVSLRLLDALTQRPQPQLRDLMQRDTLAEPRTALEKRMPGIPSGTTLQMTKIRTFAAFVPTILIAQKLIDFYDTIGMKIEFGDFSNRLPAKNIILQLWDLELTFSSDKITIPWSFVQAFVIDMANQSAQGFTGFYEATFRGEGALSGLVILVKMGLQGDHR